MLPTQPTSERIALNRVTFGARDTDVDAVKRTGWTAWVKDQLNPPEGDDPALAQYLKSLTIHIEYPAYNNAQFYSWPAVNEDRPLSHLQLSPTQLWSKSLEVYPKSDHREQQLPFYELTSATYIRNTHSRYQLREFMADFWHRHFNVYQDKDHQTKTGLIAYDRDVIRSNVFGNFRTMLEAVATSVSMLRYLDNALSEAAQPNENYARELLELHTLGRGAYIGKNSDGSDVSAKGFTDDDIIQASRALSGWTIKQGQFNLVGKADTGEFVFNPAQHNNNAGRCLGFDLATLKDGGLAQGRKVLDLAARHASTAPFVCTKLVQRIFGDTPPPAVVTRAVEAWNKYADAPNQIKHVLHSILLDGPEIGQGPSLKVRRPHERAIALLRAIDGSVKPHEAWSRFAQYVSDVPFNWQSPDGRPDTNEFWLTPQINVESWNALQLLADPSIVSTDIIAQTPKEALVSPTLCVEHWVGRIIGYSLSTTAMNALALETESLMSTYRGNQKSFGTAFFAFVISAIVTAPEFVNR